MSELRDKRAGTGITGLDDVLHGGLPVNRMYLVKGCPGVGKTTLAIQFLLEGIKRGETVLYITLSETEQEIRQVAASHEWSLDGLNMFELSVAEETLRLREENTLYASEDVDLKELMGVLMARIDQLKPSRVVFDSLSEIRLLANNSTRYRRQLLALKQDLIGRDCTTLLLDDRSGNEELQIESLAHGVLVLEQTPVQYGAERRRIRVGKLRGSAFRSGFHDYVVTTGGITVFPRLIAAEHRTQLAAEPISSGIPKLDGMLGGGIDRSTATLIIGPAGAGKSALAGQFAMASALRGEHSTLFLFEERLNTWLKRSEALGIPAERLVREGLVKVHQVDPAELAPDEFTHLVRLAVERDHAKVVVIDSITGYFNAMPEARFLSLQMHELLSYLAERGVATLLTMAQTGMLGTQMTSPVDMSYLADAVVVMRYFEVGGHLEKAVSVLKKRSGPHENSIRSITFGKTGLQVGEALVNLHGVLSGIPRVLTPLEAAREPS